jgi:serine/threonine protein kinase
MDMQGTNNQPIPTGSFIGRYEVLGLLGGGGMGMVYRAFDTRLQREVAIKVLHEKDSLPGMSERLIREARAVSAINHPSICTLYDIGDQTSNQTGAPYLVMELLHGETLRDRMRRRVLTPAEVVEYSLQIANALAEAHKNNIVHRDIKPANIFLSSKASGSIQVKVLDFGLAKRHTDLEHDTLNLTNPGMTIGTIAYMSPEQARGEMLDARTDLFSFGAVMYEMATNIIPFSGQTSAVVFVELLERDPKPVRDINTNIPIALQAIINKALRKDLSARYQSAVEIHTDLENVWATLWEPGTVVGPSSPVATQNSQRFASRATDRTLRSQSAPASSISPQPLPTFTQPISNPTNAGRESKFPESAGNIGDASGAPVAPAGQFSGTLINVGPPSGELARRSGLRETAAARQSSGSVRIAPKPMTLSTPARRKKNSRGTMLLLVSLLFAAIIGIAIYIQFVQATGKDTVLAQNDFVPIGRIENRTDSTLLDHTFRAGLATALDQSPWIRTQLAPDNAASLPGERGMLVGSITGSGPYVIDLTVLAPGGTKPIAEVQDAAQSADDILATIDRVAHELRRQAGEPSNSIDGYFRPLHQQATSSLDAFDAFARGEEIVASHGDRAAAEADYLKALSIDKYFSIASAHLALLYNADDNASEAAQYADSAYSGRQILSDHAKMQIEIIYAVLVEKNIIDAQHLLKQLHATFPGDNTLDALVK